jgi:hypothetical protein
MFQIMQILKKNKILKFQFEKGFYEIIEMV